MSEKKINGTQEGDLGELPSREKLLESFFHTVKVLNSEADLDSSAPAALGLMGGLVKARRVGLFEIFFEPLTNQEFVSFVYEWHADYLKPVKDLVPRLPASLFPTWTAKVEGLKPVVLYPEVFSGMDWPFGDELRIVQTAVVVPIVMKGRVWGVLAFELSYREPRFPEEDRMLLYEFADTLAQNIIRKRLINQLRESDEAYKAALHQGRVAYWDLDPATKILTPDPQLLIMLGYRLDEIEDPAAVWRSYVHPDDLKDLDNKMYDFMAGRLEVYEVPHRIRRKDGTWLWLLSRAHKVYDEEGAIRRVVGTDVDIDRLKSASEELEARIETQTNDLRTAIEVLEKEVEERKRSERALVSNQARLRAIFNQPKQMFVMVDRTATVLESNPTFTARLKNAFGIDIGPGTNLVGLLPEEFRSELITNIGRVFDGEEPNGEVYANGHWVEFHWSSVVDEKGVVLGACLSMTFIDDRREALEKLEQSERLFRSLVQNSADLVMRLDKSMRIVYASPALENMGFNTDGIERENIFDYLRQEELEEANEFMARMMAHPGEHHYAQLQVRDKFNQWHHTEVVGTNYLNDPAIQSVVLNIRDVSSKREAEEKLLRYHEMLISIFSQSADAFFILDNRDGRILDCNQKAVLTFDATGRLELLHNSVEIVLGNEHSASILQQLANNQDGFPLQMELELSSLKGRPFFASISAKTIRAGIERVIMLRVNDITASKLAERELFLLKSAVQFAQDAILIAQHLPEKLSTRILYINPSFERLTGYDPEESRGRNPLSLLRRDDVDPELLQSLTSMLVNEETRTFTIYCYRKDGSKYMAEWVSSPVRDDAGITRHWVAVQRDVTERVLMEEERLNQEQRMAQAVIEAQEDERRRIAEDLHDGLGQLLSVIKLQFGELEAMTEETPPKMLPYLSKARELIDHAATETRNISRNLMPSELQDFGLSQTLKHLCLQVAHTRNLEVTYQANDAERRLPMPIEVAVYRIAQEALNNAIKHAKAKEINVQLTITPESLLLIVEDDGVGFEVVETPTTLKISGMGLGNMRARARLVGGLLNIDSTKGHGTTLVLEIPLLLPIPHGDKKHEVV
jgi:PAS domain S-box-containing protein